jgi:hypothetical protein
MNSSLIEIQDEVAKVLKASKVESSKRDEAADDNYDNESFIKEDDQPIRVKSKKQSVVEVESRTSMRGSIARVSAGSAGQRRL